MQAENRKQPPTRNMKICFDGNSMLICKLWRHYSKLPMVLFAVAWNVFTIFWYFKYVAGTKSSNNPILILPLAICVALIYLTLSYAINKTCIRVSRSKIKVNSGPLPWRRSYEYDSFNIENVLIDKDTWVESAQYAAFEVKIVDNNKKEHLIIKDLELLRQAEFVREMLIEYIGLKY